MLWPHLLLTALLIVYAESIVRLTTCECGWTNPPPKNKVEKMRIVDGKEVHEGKYPFLAAVRISGHKRPCGGAILSPTHILTSARCVSGHKIPERIPPKDIEVVVGSQKPTGGSNSTQTLKVKKVSVPKEWLKKEKTVGDIAVLHLQTPITFNKMVGPVCLSPREAPINVGLLRLMGWGDTKKGPAEGVQEGDVEVAENKVCGVGEDEVCFHARPTSPCRGDGGGPFVFLDTTNNRYTALAVMSRGDEFCNATTFTGTDIGFWYKWIEDAMQESSDKDEICQRVEPVSCECGNSNLKSGEKLRIVNGKKIHLGKYPFLVAVVTRNNNLCGGAILSPTHILTAASCVSGHKTVKSLPVDDIRVLVPQPDGSKKQAHEYNVTKLSIPKQWVETKEESGNIAVLHLEKPITYNKWSSPICLTLELVPLENTTFKIMGFGTTGPAEKTSFNEGDVKRAGNECKAKKDELCFSTKAGGPCNGDQGGPLIYLDPSTDRYTQVAVISHGNHFCNGTAFNAVSTVHWFQWIKNAMAETSTEHQICQKIQPTTCDCGNVNLEQGEMLRIINGTQAPEGKYPFIVTVKTPLNSRPCGGSILSPAHIVTAARCVSKHKTIETVPAKDIEVTVGVHTLNAVASHKETQKFKVKNVSVPPEWTSATSTMGDIAVLHLESPIRYSQWVSPVCATPEDLHVVNKSVQLMGWGDTKKGAPLALMEAKIKVVDNKECKVNKDEVCLGARSSSSCRGDAGGPLVYFDPETHRYTQVALVSRQEDFCEGPTAVGTNLVHYYNWIKKSMAETDPKYEICQKI